MIDRPKTKTMARFLKKEAHRVVEFSREPDGVFISVNDEWEDPHGAHTVRGDSEADVIRRFYDRIRPARAS